MNKSITKLLTLAAVAASVTMLGSRAEAASLPGQNGIRPAVDALALIEQAQVFVWGGRRFCWYDFGWNGPGWYWCGYAWRRGFGWGGPRGYRNWWWGGWGRRPPGWGMGGNVIIVNPMGMGGPMMGGNVIINPMMGGNVIINPMMGGPVGPMGGGMMGGGNGMVSDIRAKEAIALVGRLENGLGLYRFNYIGDKQVYVGVMAHEVQELIPDAVVRGNDGYLRVHYSMVGTQMQTWEQWAGR
jgi:hypothetical protein